MDEFKYIDPNNIGGLNLYAYCNNNPVMYSDPNGTFFIFTALLALMGIKKLIAMTATAGKALKIVGGAIGKGSKMVGSLTKKHKSSIISGTFGTIAGGIDSNGGWCWSGALEGALWSVVGARVAGGLTAKFLGKAGHWTKVAFNTGISAVIAMAKGLRKGSVDIGNVLIATIFGGLTGVLGKSIGIFSKIGLYMIKTSIEIFKNLNLGGNRLNIPMH